MVRKFVYVQQNRPSRPAIGDCCMFAPFGKMRSTSFGNERDGRLVIVVETPYSETCRDFLVKFSDGLRCFVDLKYLK